MPGKKGSQFLAGVRRVPGAASAEKFVARRTESRHKGAFVMPEEFERAKQVAESALSTTNPDAPQADQEAVKKSPRAAKRRMDAPRSGA